MCKKRVFVIGGGPSIETKDLRKLSSMETIAVNKSALYVPNLNHFITMDYTLLKKVGIPRIKTIKATKHFVVNMSINYIQTVKGLPTDVRYGISYTLLFDIFDSIHVCKRQDGLGLSFSDFRCGDNSGFCALQLAFLLGYKEIYLLGFDMTTKGSNTHFHAGYREPASSFNPKVNKYAKGFIIGLETAAKKYQDVQVFSCSKISLLNEVIPYVDLNEVIHEEDLCTVPYQAKS